MRGKGFFDCKTKLEEDSKIVEKIPGDKEPHNEEERLLINHMNYVPFSKNEAKTLLELYGKDHKEGNFAFFHDAELAGDNTYMLSWINGKTQEVDFRYVSVNKSGSGFAYNISTKSIYADLYMAPDYHSLDYFINQVNRASEIFLIETRYDPTNIQHKIFASRHPDLEPEVAFCTEHYSYRDKTELEKVIFLKKADLEPYQTQINKKTILKPLIDIHPCFHKDCNRVRGEQLVGKVCSREQRAIFRESSQDMHIASTVHRRKLDGNGGYEIINLMIPYQKNSNGKLVFGFDIAENQTHYFTFDKLVNYFEQALDYGVIKTDGTLNMPLRPASSFEQCPTDKMGYFS